MYDPSHNASHNATGDADTQTPSPLADIAQALAGAAITSAPAVAVIHKTMKATVAVVQPAVSGWLRIAARMCRFR